jgi:hypothetical protein
VPSGYTAVGVPARLVGRASDARPALNMDQSLPWSYGTRIKNQESDLLNFRMQTQALVAVSDRLRKLLEVGESNHINEFWP